MFECFSYFHRYKSSRDKLSLYCVSVKYFQSLFDTLVTRSLSQVASYTIAIISINIYILVVVNIALTNLDIAGAPEAKAWHNQSKNQSVTLKVIFSIITMITIIVI